MMRKNSERKNERNHPANNPKKENGPWFLLYQSEPTAGFTAWIAVFTCCVAFTAVIQVWIFVQSERAFVYPTTANFTAGRLIENMEDTRLSIVLKNSGKGIAMVKEFNAAITHDLPPKPIYVGNGIISDQVAFPPLPNGVEIERPLIFESRWAESTTNEVKAGKKGFYFCGKFKYRGPYSFLFGLNESGFCFMYDRLSSDSTKSVFRNCLERDYTYTK